MRSTGPVICRRDRTPPTRPADFRPPNGILVAWQTGHMGTFPLVDLASYNTDKSRTYLAAYQREIGQFVDCSPGILELGIREGGSLQLWRDLFPGSQVVGLDLLDVAVPDSSGRIHTYVGFQQDRAILDRIGRERAPGGFDIIIDDASHVGSYTRESFQHLFTTHLKPGGVYVLEDWACGYDPSWPDGAAFEGPRLLDPAPAEAKKNGRRDLIENLHRKGRALAPKVSRRLDRVPALKNRLRSVYMAAEGAVLTAEFPSHEAGMVGLVKQIVDLCATEGDDRDRPIANVNVYPYQVFVHKATNEP